MEPTRTLARSPLSIIAIFAATIEASALASLPLLEEQNQYIYTWFLIGFPPFLTILFFVTLNFNNRALYSPSDFSDQDNFLKSQQLTNINTTPCNNSIENPSIDAFARHVRMSAHMNDSMYIQVAGANVHLVNCRLAKDREQCFELVDRIAELATIGAESAEEGQLIVLVGAEHVYGAP